MSIDFTLSPEHEALRVRVRTFIDDVVRPNDVAPARARPRAFGAPSPPPGHARHREVGGDVAAAHAGGVGRHGARARRAGDGAGRGGEDARRARSSSTARRPTRATCTRCCTGAPTSRRSSTSGRCATGTQLIVLRDDRARGRRLRPDAHPDPRRTRTATSGSSTATSGSSPKRAGRQFAILIARTEDDPDDPAGAPTPRSSSTSPPRAGTTCARSRRCTAPPATARSSSGPARATTARCSAAAARATCSASTGSVRPGSRTACAGSRQAEMALDMMVDRSLNRYAHGSLLAEKQGIQWMIADSAMELYQCKLMVLHAAYQHRQRATTSRPRCRWRSTSSPTPQPHHRPGDPGARRARLLDRHAARRHVPARPLGPLRRRRRRDPPDAHRRAHHQRLPRPRHDPRGHRRPADLTRGSARA